VHDSENKGGGRTAVRPTMARQLAVLWGSWSLRQRRVVAALGVAAAYGVLSYTGQVPTPTELISPGATVELPPGAETPPAPPADDWDAGPPAGW
jgi:hypothetical protein